MNETTLLADRELQGYPGARVELHVQGRNYVVEVHDAVGCEVWRPVTKREAADMFFHPFVYGYQYRAQRDDTYEFEDGA